VSMLPLISYRRADAGRGRGHAHDKEGSGQEVRRKRFGGAGEVRRELTRSCRLTRAVTEPPLVSSQGLQHSRSEHKGRWLWLGVRRLALPGF